MTVNQGSKIGYDWDEYSSELDDEYDDYEDEDEDIEPVAAATAATDTGTASSNEEETDWVMGSDGYWWYHDKEANEWWYKDANGDIVKHP